MEKEKKIMKVCFFTNVLNVIVDAIVQPLNAVVLVERKYSINHNGDAIPSADL